MMLWLKELDPFVEVIKTKSTALLPVLFKMPGLKITLHVTLYMPTHGKDSEFVSDLAELRNCLDEFISSFSDDDNGNYACLVTNQAGTSTSNSFPLFVTG